MLHTGVSTAGCDPGVLSLSRSLRMMLRSRYSVLFHDVIRAQRRTFTLSTILPLTGVQIGEHSVQSKFKMGVICFFAILW